MLDTYEAGVEFYRHHSDWRTTFVLASLQPATLSAANRRTGAPNSLPSATLSQTQNSADFSVFFATTRRRKCCQLSSIFVNLPLQICYTERPTSFTTRWQWHRASRGLSSTTEPLVTAKRQRYGTMYTSELNPSFPDSVLYRRFITCIVCCLKNFFPCRIKLFGF